MAAKRLTVVVKLVNNARHQKHVRFVKLKHGRNYVPEIYLITITITVFFFLFFDERKY